MDSQVWMGTGRLAMDPILKSYVRKSDGEAGSRCFFRVAITRLSDRGEKDRTKRRTNFVPVVAWGEAAKRHAEFLAKGTMVTIMGEVIAESRPKAEGEGYDDFFAIQANDVQYGPRSRKNATPEQLATDVQALTRRIDELQAKGGSDAGEIPAEAPEPDDSPAQGESPFKAEGGEAQA